MQRFLSWLSSALDRLSLWIDNMANSYYTPSGQPSTASRGRSINVREEFALVEDGFDAVETAMNLKAPKASPTFTGTVVLPSTTSIGNVSATELSYLDGVTSGIQAQLDGKATVSSASWTPELQSSTGGSSFDYTQRSGRYIKIGELVIATGQIVLDSGATTLSGSILDKIRLGGLPFAGRTGLLCAGSGQTPLYGGFGGADVVPIGMNVVGGLSYATIRVESTSAPIISDELNGENATLFMQFNFCITYLTN